MSQRRSNVLTFRKSSGFVAGSPSMNVGSIKCAMLRANLRNSLPVVDKAARLHAVAPDLASFVEDLIDDLLAEVS